MQPVELPHYPTLQHTPTDTPVTKEIALPQQSTVNIQTSLESTINSIFTPQTEESKVTRTRKHLGETGKSFSDEQIECMVTEFQFLIGAWLDEYERDVFNGLTLREVLHEG